MVESSQSEQAEHEALVHVREILAALSRSEKGRKAALARVDELDRQLQPLLPPPSDAPIETFYRSDDEFNAIAERIDEAQRIRNERSREEWERMVNALDQ